MAGPRGSPSSSAAPPSSSLNAGITIISFRPQPAHLIHTG
jgi:hypothetical protein